jgi:hypothetical protein
MAPRLLTVLACAAIVAAPLRAASANAGPQADPPAPAPATAEPAGPPPEQSAPPAADEPTPEERAKQLGWDEEPTETQPDPAEADAEDEDESDEDEEPEEPDVDDVIEADPVLEKDYSKARAMAIGGGVTAAVGLALAGSGAYLVANETLSRDSAGFVSNRGREVGGWVMMSLGLAALTTGVVVMALGLAKRKRVLTEAEARLPPTAMVSPWFGKRSGGVGLSLRF